MRPPKGDGGYAVGHLNLELRGEGHTRERYLEVPGEHDV